MSAVANVDGEKPEEWRVHPEFPTYLLSSYGYVAKMRRGRVVRLKGTKCGRGYVAIDFRGEGSRKREYIHRAICAEFNGPCPDGHECRHLDGNMANNRADNLAWGTPKENQSDRYLHGTIGFGEKNPMAVLTQEQVDEMRRLRDETRRPYHAIAKEYGISTMTAFRAITKRAWI